MKAPAGIVSAYFDGSSVVAISRDAAGIRRKARFPVRNCAYLAIADLDDVKTRNGIDLADRLCKWYAVKGVRKVGAYLEVEFRNQWDLREATYRLRNPHPTKGGYETIFDRLHIPTYEADVYPVRRWLTDHDVEIQRPRRVYLDLETDSDVPFSQKERARILSWSIIDDAGDYVGEVLEDDTDQSERALLAALWEELDAYDQIAAWNGDDFDFPVLRARTKHAGIQVAADGWLWLDHMLLFKKLNMQVSESGDEKQSVALGRVAAALFGEGKADLDASKTRAIWQSGEEGRAELLRYNLQDVDLMRRIEEKTGYCELLYAIGHACNTLPDSRGMQGTHYVEGYLLKRAAAAGIRFPSLWKPRDVKTFDGAFVLEPTRKGILRNVHVADFSGMYPSIIQTWNISPDTYEEGCKADAAGNVSSAWAFDKNWTRPADVCAVPGGACFRTGTVGLVPDAVTELKRLRKEWAVRKAQAVPGTDAAKDAERKSNAYKVAANTFYGVLGAPSSRFYHEAVASGVTAAGRWLISETIKAAEARGWAVIYADTDSIFVSDVSESEFGRFVDWLNAEHYPKLLKALGCVRNEIQIAYEKAFDRIILIRKKRYAGRFSHYKGTRAEADSKPEIKGLEFKRGDSTRLARDLQHRVVMMILDGCEDTDAVHRVIVEARDHVLTGDLPMRDFELSKSLSKPLEDYAQRTSSTGKAISRPTHVEIGALLKARGEPVREGSRISYVVTDGSASPMVAIPSCDYTPGVEDRHYLWENQVWPPTLRVLEAAFPEVKWSAMYSRTRPTRYLSNTRRTAKVPPEGQLAFL